MIGAIQPHHVWDWIGTYLISFPLNGSATVDHLIVVSSIINKNEQKWTGFSDIKNWTWLRLIGSKVLNPKCYKHLSMPCPSTGPKIVCASPNFLSQTKIYLR